MNEQSWLQTLAIMGTIVVVGGGVAGFFWLNIPSNSDFANLKADFANLKADFANLKADFAKLESKVATKEDLKSLEIRLEKMLSVYQDDVKSMRYELSSHIQNYSIHAAARTPNEAIQNTPE